jgi:hypothetical protein
LNIESPHEPETAALEDTPAWKAPQGAQARARILPLLIWATVIFLAIVSLGISYPVSIIQAAVKAGQIPMLSRPVINAIGMRYLWHVLLAFSLLLLFLFKKRKVQSKGFQLWLWIGLVIIWVAGFILSPLVFFYTDLYFMIQFDMGFRFVYVFKAYLALVTALVARQMWKRVWKSEFIST